MVEKILKVRQVSRIWQIIKLVTDWQVGIVVGLAASKLGGIVN